MRRIGYGKGVVDVEHGIESNLPALPRRITASAAVDG